MKQNYLTREEEYKLIRLGQNGDTDARNKVILGILPLIQREANKLAHKHNKNVEDLVNLCIVKIIDYFCQFDLSRGFRASTYFIRIAYNEMIDWCLHDDRLIQCPRTIYNPKLKERARKAKETVSIWQLPEFLFPQPAEESLDYASSMLKLQEAIRFLDPVNRSIVEDKLIGLTYAEIAKKHKLTKQRIQQRFSRAIKTIRSIV